PPVEYPRPEDPPGPPPADPPLPPGRPDDAVQDPLEVGDAQVVLRDPHELELVGDEAAGQRDAKAGRLRLCEPVVAAREGAEAPERRGQHVERDVPEARESLPALPPRATPA